MCGIYLEIGSGFIFLM